MRLYIVKKKSYICFFFCYFFLVQVKIFSLFGKKKKL